MMQNKRKENVTNTFFPQTTYDSTHKQNNIT